MPDCQMTQTPVGATDAEAEHRQPRYVCGSRAAGINRALLLLAHRSAQMQLSRTCNSAQSGTALPAL